MTKNPGEGCLPDGLGLQEANPALRAFNPLSAKTLTAEGMRLRKSGAYLESEAFKNVPLNVYKGAPGDLCRVKQGSVISNNLTGKLNIC